MKSYFVNADSLKPYVKTIMVSCPHCSNTYVASVVGYDEDTREIYVSKDSLNCRKCKKDITADAGYFEAIKQGI